ncbi:hypothetical protein J437_LFUL000786, partial [Ladona fulva]
MANRFDGYRLRAEADEFHTKESVRVRGQSWSEILQFLLMDGTTLYDCAKRVLVELKCTTLSCMLLMFVLTIEADLIVSLKSSPSGTEASTTSSSPNSVAATAGAGGNNAPKYGTLIPNRIFVGGISGTTTEEDLTQLFSAYGNVRATKIISDRAGVSKGYGFVTFETEEEARRLHTEADCIVLKERKLNIAPAIKKQAATYPIQPFNRGYETTPAVPTGTVFFHNGYPYTYQNGMAFFAAAANGSPDVTSAAAAAAANGYVTSPYPQPQPPPAYPATTVMFQQPMYIPQQYQYQTMQKKVHPPSLTVVTCQKRQWLTSQHLCPTCSWIGCIDDDDGDEVRFRLPPSSNPILKSSCHFPSLHSLFKAGGNHIELIAWDVYFWQTTIATVFIIMSAYRNSAAGSPLYGTANGGGGNGGGGNGGGGGGGGLPSISSSNSSQPTGAYFTTGPPPTSALPPPPPAMPPMTLPPPAQQHHHPHQPPPAQMAIPEMYITGPTTAIYAQQAAYSMPVPEMFEMPPMTELSSAQSTE